MPENDVLQAPPEPEKAYLYLIYRCGHYGKVGNRVDVKKWMDVARETLCPKCRPSRILEKESVY